MTCWTWLAFCSLRWDSMWTGRFVFPWGLNPNKLVLMFSRTASKAYIQAMVSSSIWLKLTMTCVFRCVYVWSSTFCNKNAKKCKRYDDNKWHFNVSLQSIWSQNPSTFTSLITQEADLPSEYLRKLTVESIDGQCETSRHPKIMI